MRVIAVMLFFHAIAPLVAPLVGAELVTAFGWNAMFVFITIYTSTVTLLFWLVFRETLAEPDRNALRILPMLRNFGTILRSLPFWAYTACASASYGMLFSFLAASAHVIITSFGETTRTYGLVVGATMLGTMLGMLGSAQLVHRYGPDRLLRFGVSGASVTGVALVALAWAGMHHWLAIIGPMFFCLIAFSLHPSASNSRRIATLPPHGRDCLFPGGVRPAIRRRNHGNGRCPPCPTTAPRPPSPTASCSGRCSRWRHMPS